MKVTKQVGWYKGDEYSTYRVMVGKYAKASCMVVHTNPTVFLKEMHVFSEEDYRKGYASALLKTILNDYKCKIGLQVYKDNESALKLYEKFGFKVSKKTRSPLMEMILEVE